jgi:hypothetical protein
MAKHQVHPGVADAVCAAEAPTTIRFKLDGLRQSYSEDGVFELIADTRPINLQRVYEDLVAQGLSERLAEEACEGMSEFVFGRQLAEHFAKHMKRVG